MSRISHLLPVKSGREEECARVFERHAEAIDRALRDIGVRQCVVLRQGSSFVVVVDWERASYISVVRAFVRHQAVQEFISEIAPLLDIPASGTGADAVREAVDFLESRSLRQVYSLEPPP